MQLEHTTCGRCFFSTIMLQLSCHFELKYLQALCSGMEGHELQTFMAAIVSHKADGSCSLLKSSKHMSISSVQQCLVEHLEAEDAELFEDTHIQNLVDKGYTNVSLLKSATREGLQTPAIASCAD